MEKQKAYTHLAEWFEYLNDDCDYENWSQYFILKLKSFGVQTGLDIGCGGGYFTRAFTRAGFQMTGMDISPQMLDTAQRKALEEGARAEYILGDISKKKPQKRFEFVTAINDLINYIPKDKLKSALKNIHASLKKGGVFLFDVSSPRKFQTKIANTVSVDDRDEVTYLAFNRLEGDKAILEVTLFIKDGEKYIRKDETHLQYVYTEEELCAALEESGFTVLEIEGHLGEEKSQSDRICFTAKKEN